jgi:alpha-tubulin suppressor-like RCC1 family protein
VGVLGIGTALGTRTMAEKSDVPLRVTVIGNAQVATVAAGADFTCVSTKDGDVRCWGDNNYGKRERED